MSDPIDGYSLIGTRYFPQGNVWESLLLPRVTGGRVIPSTYTFNLLQQGAAFPLGPKGPSIHAEDRMNFKLTPNIAAVSLLVVIVLIKGEPKLFLYGIGGYLLGYLISKYVGGYD